MTNATPADTETDEFDVVLGDPAAYFHHPQAVLDDPSLTMTERRHLLNAWAQDLADRSASVDEGMVPENLKAVERDVALTAAVELAISKLPVDDKPGLMAVTGRLWRRLTSGE